MPADRSRDRISLTGVTAYGHHGVLDFEKRDGQEFVVDVAMDVDLTAAASTDDLTATVSYAEVAADVVEVVSGPSLDLIEAVAGAIADRVLARPLLESVAVTVHKPQAPVGVPFGDVSVTVRRDRDVPVVIALGANLGDPQRTVHAAGRRLHRVRGLRAVRLSPAFATSPVGGPEQPDYVNAVAVARTRLTPASLLAALHRIEEDHGRTREVRWGARTLDLDLVQYGTPGTDEEVRSDDPALTLPHPRAHERGFVLAPWAAVDPAALLRMGEDLVPVAEQVQRVGLDGIAELGAQTR